MKKWVMIGMVLVSVVTCGRAQSFEVQQLVLDIQKLSQEKQLLNDLYNGYVILEKGYGAIRDISKGSFDLHKAFLDGLLAVSPAVKKYKRIADIVDLQVKMIGAYAASWGRVRSEGRFSAGEVELIGGWYSGLLGGAAQALNSLTVVLTDGQLRADDGERMRQIDELYSGMRSRWTVLQAFNDQVGWLSAQRVAAARENKGLRKLFGLND